MRLWHKDLICVLPREQLIGAWRECSAIAGAILKNGTTNHILINKVMNYDFNHFISYSLEIRKEMTRRGYRTMQSVEDKITSLKYNFQLLPIEEIYPNWHNRRYLTQCYCNLEEKADCNGIEAEDWNKIYNRYKELCC